MSGPKRNPDRLNTIGIVVVGLCGAVLVYVTIVALEAFYVNDTSEIQTMADYGGQDTTFSAISSRCEDIVPYWMDRLRSSSGNACSYRFSAWASSASPSRTLAVIR